MALLLAALALAGAPYHPHVLPYGTQASWHSHHGTFASGITDDRSGWSYHFPVKVPARVVRHHVRHPARHVQRRRRGSAAVRVPRGRWVSVFVTGYDDVGYTASGLLAGYGRVAVDPRVFPLGTRFWIPGYGYAVAADTGSAVIGYHIDLWFPTVSQCNANTGMRSVEVLS